MKNKYFILIISYFFLCKISFAEPFTFKTSEIEIKQEGNLIYATNGKAISSDNNLEISAKKFEYYKDRDFLIAFDGIAFIKNDNLEIEFKEIELDQKKNFFEAKNNVKIFQNKEKLSIQTNKLTYDLVSKTLESKTNSVLKDQFKNTFKTEFFNYDIKNNILKIQNANFIDSANNKFYVELAFINTLTNKLFGKDVAIDLNNNDFNKDNEPRLKGKSIIYENENTEITKGVFTTCKKNDNCPPWQISAEKIFHDKKNKIVNYKNAWLKIYNTPVVYFPKFFHPDPTVDRQSGFLIPTIKNSSSESYLSVPYFYAISMNKDMTLTPRLYSDDKLLVQSEFRQVNASSNHLADFSIYKKKENNSKSHFFYKFNKSVDLTYFDESNLSLSIEKTSNDTYLKGNKLTSPIIKNYDVLENSLNFNFYSDDLSINSELIIYEDLTKNNSSDRYEFILPNLNFTKTIENKTNLDGNFLFNSNNLIRNYQTNIFEKTNINDLIFNSNPSITKNGFYNNFDFIIKNVNSDTQNSKSFKEDENYYLSGLFQFNSSLPLIKESDRNQKILKPKLSLKLSPQDTKNLSDEEIRLDATNIYSLDRLSKNDTLEGGLSLAVGNEFTVFDKIKSRDILSLKLATNLRNEENNDLPDYNQLGQKTSNFFGEIDYNPIEFLSMKYSTSVKNNVKDVNYQNLITQLSLNNFVTTFDYLNENNTKDKNSYLLNTTSYALNRSNKLIFSTRENKTLDLTEYYNLMYQYKNDCLAASIEYNKEYYDDRDIKPEENIFLKLTIIPFGETSSPNLKK